MKAEGDSFIPDEALCQMVVGGITLEFESDRAGVIIEKLVNEGQIVPVGHPILNCAVNKEIYLEYIDSKRIEAVEHGNPEAEDVKSEVKESKEKEKEKKPDKLVLMREIKHLFQENHIDEESGKLLSFLAIAFYY
jgi:pyruvate/2-oxoglutarate dehydrogenase complex dihydrolipoamide acyltransferase (E2) component